MSRAIDVGGQDGLAVEVRAGEHLAERADDAAAAARHDGRRVVAERRRVVGGIVRATGELVGRQHEASPFAARCAASSTARCRGRRPSARSRCRRPSRTSPRAAAACSSPSRSRRRSGRCRCRCTGQRRAVAESPDEPLAGGRHQLAVLAEVTAVRAEEEHGAVERAALALDDADHEMQPVGAGDPRRADRRPGRARRWRSPSSGGTARDRRRSAIRRPRRSRGRADRPRRTLQERARAARRAGARRRRGRPSSPACGARRTTPAPPARRRR